MEHIWDLEEREQKKIILLILIDRYYEFEAAGGILHIVLDDHNFGKGMVEACLAWAKREGINDVMGEMIGNLLLEFDEEEQEQLIINGWEIRAKYHF